MDKLVAQIRTGHQGYEQSEHYVWKNGYRDDSLIQFTLDYLADPANEGTAEALEEIDRRRAGHQRGQVAA